MTYWNHRQARHTPAPVRQGAGGSGEAFWQERYAGASVWSGQANPVLVQAATALTAGRALDLGCGDGSDALWLAERGWAVTTVDISATALARVAARATAAAEAGMSGRVRAERHDLAATFPAGAFDLVSAHYLLSPVDFERAPVFAAAAAAVAPGGTLLIVDHAELPPWVELDVVALTGQALLESIAADLTLWQVVRAGDAARQPRGEHDHHTSDTIVQLRRPLADPT